MSWLCELLLNSEMTLKKNKIMKWTSVPEIAHKKPSVDKEYICTIINQHDLEFYWCNNRHHKESKMAIFTRHISCPITVM